MRNAFRILWIVSIYFVLGQGTVKGSSGLSSLCELQVQLNQGEQRTVRVEGVYLAGLEGQILVTAGCSGRSTDIEFDLKSHRLWNRLLRLSNKTNARKHVYGDGDPLLVVFEGDFYGPRVPDPKLPDSIRKIYHPAWDNSNSMTKLVVHTIQSVETLPADHPCAPPKSDPTMFPCLRPEP